MMKRFIPNRLADYFVVVGHDEAEPFLCQGQFPVRMMDIRVEELTFKPTILDRFPFTDYPETPLSPECPLFCLPGGVTVTQNIEFPSLFSFALTGGDGARLSGLCLLFYEPLSKQGMQQLENCLQSMAHSLETEEETEDDCHDNGIPRVINSESPIQTLPTQLAGQNLDCWCSPRATSPVSPKSEEEEDFDNIRNFSYENVCKSWSVEQLEENRVVESEDILELNDIAVQAPSLHCDSTVPQDLASLLLFDNNHAEVSPEDSPRATPSGGRGSILDHTKSYYITKSICILSHWPLFSTFKTFLTELYRHSIQATGIPLERYIGNFMLEVPLPPPGKIRVQWSIGDKIMYISRPPVNELPLCDVPFDQLFKALDLNNITLLFTFLLTEKQIVLFSSHNSLMGTVAEAMCSLMFPFYWHHVYIPLLPRDCLDFLSAPVPFFMGINRRYFNDDLCPKDVVRVDLDSNSIRHSLRVPNLPERQHRKLSIKLAQILGDFNVGTNRRQLNHIDMAFMTAPTPEDIDEEQVASRSKMGPSENHELGEIDKPHTAAVRYAFYRFFVSLFQKYKNYCSPGDAGEDFRKQAFIRDQHDSARPFLKEFLETQAFQHFIYDRTKLSFNDFEALFFDESIQAKLNRSIFAFHKHETPFLNDKSFNVDKTDVARAPDTSGLDDYKACIYPTFPRLRAGLFAVPRSVKVLVSQDSPDVENQSIDILASWKTILATLAALSSKDNRLVRSGRLSVIGRVTNAMRLSAGASTLSPGSPSPPHQRSGSGSGSLGARVSSDGFNGADLLSDLSLDPGCPASPNEANSCSTVSFAGATLYVNNMDESSISTLARFHFDTRDACPACKYELSDEEIRGGWSNANAQEYRTTCPQCGCKFVARFSVRIDERNGAAPSPPHANSQQSPPGSRPTMAGMKFEYLSPITLRKEVENLVKNDVCADERLLQEHPMMFWNLIVHFRNLKIPLNFLLPQVVWELIFDSVTFHKSHLSKEGPTSESDAVASECAPMTQTADGIPFPSEDVTPVELHIVDMNTEGDGAATVQ